MRTVFKYLSVVAGFSIVVVVLTAGTLLERVQLERQQKALFLVQHARQVLLDVETTESLLKDAEAGQRGFLFTGDQKYLEPYNAAKAQIGARLDEMASLVADNPVQAAAVVDLRRLSDEKLAELQQTVDLFRSGKAQEARNVALSDRGMVTMDRIRETTGRMRAEEQRLEMDRGARYARSVRVTLASVYVDGLLGIAGLSLLTILVVRNIWLRERHVEDIRAREEWFRVTLTSIGDAVIATDPKGSVTFLNPLAEKLIGRTTRNSIGRPIQEVFPIFDELTGAVAVNPVRKAMESGSIVGFANHTLLERVDGSRIPIEDIAAPIRDDRNALIGVVLVFRDATNDRRSQELLRRTEKLAAAARLSATVAHEINNPLAAVGNLIFLAKLHPGAPAELLEQLTLAEGELARVAHITRQTLGFYRETNERQPLDVAAILDSVIDLHANKMRGKDITVVRNYEPCPQVLGAAGELRQVFANLVSNAADAVPSHGHIMLTTRRLDDSAQGMLQILVEDDGPGIPVENAARIFEPFFTTKKDVGTGLGLYVCREIVERNGGRIFLLRNGAERPRGARFELRLPYQAPADAAEALRGTSDAVS